MKMSDGLFLKVSRLQEHVLRELSKDPQMSSLETVHPSIAKPMQALCYAGVPRCGQAVSNDKS